MNRILYEPLLKFHREILTKVGLDAETMEAVSHGLCETSLRGVDSHGIRLLPHYVKSAIMGRKNPRPNYSFTKKFPTIGLLDADNTFGHAAGMKAIDYCLEMAEEFGVGIVGVSNSSHPGAMASFALKAARLGYIAFAFTHADPLTLSHDGKRPYFGTNPVCVAVPREEEEPYCLDMATSMISWNKLLLHKSNNKPLTEALAADKDGQPTKDPQEAVSLLPAGAYKGYGLASMVEILCSVFTGMAFGRDIPSMYKAPMDKPRHLGQFYLVMRSDGCIEKSEFSNMMQQMTNEVRLEPAQENQKVMLAGDPQKYETLIRKREGIPLDQSTLKDFQKLSQQYSVPLQLV
jgi:ureidoglycolate dehydrogenase (NAD+)